MSKNQFDKNSAKMTIHNEQRWNTTNRLNTFEAFILGERFGRWYYNKLQSTYADLRLLGKPEGVARRVLANLVLGKTFEARLTLRN